MSQGPALTHRCLDCGFETSSGSDEWEHTEDPVLGRLAKCPECGSTNTTSLRRGT